MKIDTFVKNFKVEQTRNEYLSKTIKREYVPYVTKVADCERIARSCNHIEVAGKRKYNVNSPAQAMMFILLLLSRYTNIDISYNAEDYDKLQSIGAIKAIIEMIPAGEYQEYSTVMRMVNEDMAVNENSLTLRFDDFKESIVMAVNRYLEGIEAAANDVLESDNGEEQSEEIQG